MNARMNGQVAPVTGAAAGIGRAAAAAFAGEGARVGVPDVAKGEPVARGIREAGGDRGRVGGPPVVPGGRGVQHRARAGGGRRLPGASMRRGKEIGRGRNRR